MSAGPLEDLAWSGVLATLLEREKLREGMATARAAYAASAGCYQSRLEALDGEVARQRSRLARIVEEQLDAPAGSGTARLLREKAQRFESALGRPTAERT